MKKYLWFLPAFIGGIIARLYLISTYTFLVPDSDQWSVDVEQVFLPLKMGTFHLRNLFIPFYEHRLVWQRLYDLALFKLNNDHINNVIQCRITAILFCAIVCLCGIKLSQKIGRVIPIAIGCACLTIMPFGWESTTSAFQTQTYFYEFAVFVSCYLFATEQLFLGCVLSLCGIFTTATGFIGVVAYGIYLFLYFLVHTDRSKDKLLSLAMQESIYIGIAILGISCIAFSPYDKSLASSSCLQTIEYFFRYLSWPSYLSPCMACLNLLPISMLIFFWSKGFLKSLIVDFIIIAFIAICIQAYSLAHGRANSPSIFISRYQDQISPLLILNILSLCIIYDYVGLKSYTFKFVIVSFSISAILGFLTIIDFCNRDSLFWAGVNKHNTEVTTEIAYITKDPNFFYERVKDQRIWPGRDEQHKPEVVHFCEMMKNTNITFMVPLFSPIKQ